jgi:hypothetical protein
MTRVGGENRGRGRTRAGKAGGDVVLGRHEVCRLSIPKTPLWQDCSTRENSSLANCQRRKFGAPSKRAPDAIVAFSVGTRDRGRLKAVRGDGVGPRGERGARPWTFGLRRKSTRMPGRLALGSTTQPGRPRRNCGKALASARSRAPDGGLNSSRPPARCRGRPLREGFGGGSGGPAAFRRPNIR